MNIHQNTNIEIIELKLRDFDVLKMFHVEHSAEYFISDTSFEGFLNLPQYSVFATIDDFKKILGYVIVLIADCNLDIVYIVASKENRNVGIGSKMMMFLFDINAILENNFIQKIYAEVVVDNFGAIKFYQKFAFEKIGIRKQYSKNKNGEWVDSYLLAKCI